MHRGEVWAADVPGIGRHPVVIVTRDVALPVLQSVACVVISSTLRRHRAEVELNGQEGLDHASGANCDNLVTVKRSWFVRRLGSLGPAKLHQLDDALRLALDL
jgi:mRNA interferase MazF